MLRLNALELDIFELVLDSIRGIERYRRTSDRNVLDQSFDQLRRAQQVEPDYLLAPYYMAVIDDLLGRHVDAALRLADLMRRMQRAQRSQEPRSRARHDANTQIALELRVNFVTARYHLLRERSFERLGVELDRLLEDLRSYRSRQYRGIRHRAQVLQAQLLVTRMIPSDPDNFSTEDRRRILRYHQESQQLARNLAFTRWPLPLRYLLSARAKSNTAIAAIARNALARAEMYLSDYFYQPEEKIERLRWALEVLNDDFDRFPGDRDNNYDRASCHMRLGIWSNDATEYDRATTILTRTIDQHGEGYGFEEFTLGRIFRLNGEYDRAVQTLNVARAIAGDSRGISDERVDREIRLALARDRTYP